MTDTGIQYEFKKAVVPTIVANRVRAAVWHAESLGLTGVEIGERAGCSEFVVSRFKRGKGTTTEGKAGMLWCAINTLDENDCAYVREETAWLAYCGMPHKEIIDRLWRDLKRRSGVFPIPRWAVSVVVQTELFRLGKLHDGQVATLLQGDQH